MKFLDCPLAGAKIVQLEPHPDERGQFVRMYCEQEFVGAGVEARIVQTNLSTTVARGTLRGMHFQRRPSHEAKLVQCIAGAIYDVIIDLRPKSPTFCRHFAIELSPASGLGLFVPSGFAHGFQTIQPDVQVLYHMTDYYRPELSCGVRWDDSAFGIHWPFPPTTMSERDRSYPDFAQLGTRDLEGF